MSFPDIHEVWYKGQFQDPIFQPQGNLFDKLGCVKPLDPLHGAPPPDNEEAQDYGYGAEIIPDALLDMLSECPKEEMMQECLISHLTPETGKDDEGSLFDFSASMEVKTQEKAPKSKNSTSKNILGYETKKVIKLMFSKHNDYLSRKCKAQGILYRQFKKYYTYMDKKLYGPESLNKLFKIDPNNQKETKMKTLFLKVFHKILRKEYIVYSLTLGKMQDLRPYIQKKNLQLLYYADCGLNAFQ